MKIDTKNNIADLMRPIWRDGGTAYRESATPFINKDGIIVVELLYEPRQIISVTSANLTRKYVEGTDYIKIKNGIEIAPDGNIPFMSRSELYPEQKSDKSFGGRCVPLIAFSEGHVFHDRQISITYSHDDNWEGPMPVGSANSLPRLSEKIRSMKPLKILIYGDSIATGANASGVMGAPPFQKAFGELFAEKLSLDYELKTEVINTSVGGTDSAWGQKHSSERAAVHRSDLVVIAFGMNDGSGHVDADVFNENIAGIIENIRNSKKDTEFILVTPMLANPEACLYGTQDIYNASLKKLAGDGVAVAEVTPIHRYLLSKKAYIDMTGNNVNHPNDYLHRIYAQILYNTLLT